MAKINVALIGQGFMGRSHSNAWGQVAKFFKPPLHARDAHRLRPAGRESRRRLPTTGAGKMPPPTGKSWSARRRSGWSTWSRPTTCTPRWPRRPLPPASRCSCEKPIAGSLADAREMVEAAKAAKVKTFVWFNYRRCPAVALAHQLVKAGKLGEIRHVRASLSARLGRPRRCRWCGGSTRSWPAPAPTAI